MFPANARALLLPPSGIGVLIGNGEFGLRVIGEPRHRVALDQFAGSGVLRCAALLTPDGRDYDPHGVMVKIRGHEVGFIHWMDGQDFRARLREAGFLQAACKAEITGNHTAGDGWNLVGVTIDASHPFKFISIDDWHKKRKPNDGGRAASHG